MGNWGIAETAPKEEKIKANFFDVLNGLNSTGTIDYIVYSQLFDEFEKVADELTQLKAEKSGEWVSIKDGLPEFHKQVLVYTTDNNIWFDKITINNNWVSCNNDIVTHWQPLPQPPKEGD